MQEHTQDRLFAACGIASVVLRWPFCSGSPGSSGLMGGTGLEPVTQLVEPQLTRATKQAASLA